MKLMKNVILVSISLALFACCDKPGDDTKRGEGTETCKDCNFPSEPYDFYKIKKACLKVPEKNQAMLSDDEKYALPYSFCKKTSNSDNWIVFSDREDNVTYKTPCGNEVHKTKDDIHYLDAFLVADSCHGWLRIIKGEEDNDFFSKDAEDYGWIHEDNLLCWRDGIITSKTRVHLKTIVFNTEESVRKSDTNTNVKEVPFYSVPSLREDKKTGITSPLFRTYFIYKREGNAYLLGTQPDFRAGNVRNIIKGWANESQFIVWNNRLVLEPSWGEDANERKNKNIKALFFSSKAEAEKYQKGQNNTPLDNLEKAGITFERKDGQIFRYPYFSYNEENPNIVYMANIGVLPKEIGDVQVKLGSAIETNKNINILFVLDCTGSMGPYISRIADAIEHQMKVLERQTKNNIKFAAFGYRDITKYGKERVLEQPSFNFENATKVGNFLRSSRMEAIDTKNGDAEQMYYGLESALKHHFSSRDTAYTNVVVLVGDAGNHRNESDEKIVDLLSKYNCHFMVFQVANHKDIAYDDFILQAKDIALKTAKKRIKVNERNKGVNYSPAFEFSKTDRRHSLTNATNTYLIYECQKGKEQSQETFENAIEHTISEVNKAVDELNYNITNKYYGDSSNFKSGAFSIEVYNNLLSKGITKEQVDRLQKKEAQVLFPGYTTLTHKDLKGKLFKFCLFINGYELRKMRDNIDVIIKFESGDKRNALTEAFIKILQKQYGQEVDENTNFSEIRTIVESFTPNARIFKGIVKLGDLYKEDLIPNDTIEEYWRNLKYSWEKLNSILAGEEECPQFRLPDSEIYYWIPQDYLP